VMDAWTDESDGERAGDERLRLIFTCCHPALTLDARVALTLRTLAGLTTAEIARAFLVSEPAMAKRLVRAKTKIRNAGIPYRVPPLYVWPERLGGVLAVVYLLFNEGYHASAGADVMRRQLAQEAIRLGRALATLMPDEPEVAGLLSLMLLHDARRDARVDGVGNLVSLEEQDRSRWDHAAIAEGVALLDAAARRESPGVYQVQAGIARCHVTAATAAQTDWTQIVGRYDELWTWMPTSVVALNRAVAVAMADGPDVGLALVDDLIASGELAGHPMLSATRADLLRRAGRASEAATEYRDAVEQARTDDERRYLRRRLGEVSPAG
jgi:RNA polymerase sigma-70 factor (ECF subfamily)